METLRGRAMLVVATGASRAKKIMMGIRGVMDAAKAIVGANARPLE